ncbi:unnamed protein product [Paramecium pentaurelia]|uniref:Uncharacterized protein n=1 Tax=Paramecium pentaurelia TaxID=43138 RepID=A0A8S1T0F3_9CILI|nr:unnamed protein product [Paramecium pentaurelia]
MQRIILTIESIGQSQQIKSIKTTNLLIKNKLALFPTFLRISKKLQILHNNKQEQPYQPFTQNYNKGLLKDNKTYPSYAKQKGQKIVEFQILNKQYENQNNGNNNFHYSIFKNKQQSISNQLLYEPFDYNINQQQNKIKQSAQTLSNFQDQQINDNKSQLDLSQISSKSIGPHQVKLTLNLLNLLLIEYEQTLKLMIKVQNIQHQWMVIKNISCSKRYLNQNMGQMNKTIKNYSQETLGLCTMYSTFKNKNYSSGSVDQTGHLWNQCPFWKQIHICEGHEDRIKCLQFFGNFIASGSDDTYVKF